MAELVKISPDQPNAVAIWGFHDPCSVRDVAAAVSDIAKDLVGDGNVINIMSGTHGYCSGAVGAVATRDQRFADEDRSLAHPKTADGKTVTLKVFDFNNGDLGGAPDRVSAAMSKLNTQMRDIATDSAHQSFLLAYCCSAGTR